MKRMMSITVKRRDPRIKVRAKMNGKNSAKSILYFNLMRGALLIFS